MSTDLFIYAPGPKPISCGQIHAAASSRGWHVFVVNGTKPVEPNDASLGMGEHYDVYGAKETATLEKARASVGKKGGAGLDALYKRGLNSIYFDVSPLDPDERIVPSKFAKDLAVAKISYVLNGHGGPLQSELWPAVAAITGGLMEDPQSGEITRAPRVKKSAPAKSAKPKNTRSVAQDRGS